jgi:hypothetical protein
MADANKRAAVIAWIENPDTFGRCRVGRGGLGVNYFLDTEFNGFGGVLLSLALVREDGASLYLIYDPPERVDRWVQRHVVPKLLAVPGGIEPRRVDQAAGARAIGAFLAGDSDPVVLADWPEDVSLFCGALLLGPGCMVMIERLGFEILRVEPYPTDVPGAVEHNAWWDAMALRRRLTRREAKEGDPPMRGPDLGAPAP